MRDLLLLAIHLLVTLANSSARAACAGSQLSLSCSSINSCHENSLATEGPPPPFSPIVVRATRWLADQQSLPTACAESHHARSPCARADHPLREPTSYPEAIRESQASYAIQVPQGVSPSKIPSAVLLFMPKTKAWPERPFRATHRGHRQAEAPQSEVQLCPHRPADRSRLWHRDRQRCRAPRACQTRSTRAGCRWSESRSEEHTSELQSHLNLVCRLLLEKKKEHT